MVNFFKKKCSGVKLYFYLEHFLHFMILCHHFFGHFYFNHSYKRYLCKRFKNSRMCKVRSIGCYIYNNERL